ncbi:MAG: polyprenyl synthetase family protein [Candidatus Zixiibacteriota bacterium]|nr:MAG: polyprenyl synthetase family protein [candidate division Zixibacteria bacterium]
MDLSTYLVDRAAMVDAALDQLLPREQVLPARLHQSMRYSVFAGGKRIRPILMIAACEAVGGDISRVIPAACALEMIHTYSLVHDDLPAMDDDDYRRGRLTNHKVYGEATAILAGDALLTQAFTLLSADAALEGVSSDIRLKVIHTIASAAGSFGMVGGQVVDMESEGTTFDLPTLEYIHTHKTGALILASITVGALVGGADPTASRALERYGATVGLAFQIADDILDIVGDLETIGKDVGSDEARGKATYPALLGLGEARSRARELRDIAVSALDPLGEKADRLRQIAHFVIDRTF